jgi:hypothetical protein
VLSPPFFSPENPPHLYRPLQRAEHRLRLRPELINENRLTEQGTTQDNSGHFRTFHAKTRPRAKNFQEQPAKQSEHPSKTVASVKVEF